jgi:GNAT superfamily N-acetyltransferase
VITVERYPDPQAFLAACESWLCEREVENNLILGLAHEVAGQVTVPSVPPYFAAVRVEGAIGGCAFRTLSGKVGVTRIGHPGAQQALAEDALAAEPDANAVIGPEPSAGDVAGRLAALLGGQAVCYQRQRIHEVRAVVVPAGLPGGRCRAAVGADEAMLTPWVGEMLRGISDPRDPGAVTQERVRSGQLFVWETDAPVSMAAWMGKTRHGARVALVYTPPALRGRGYATACVTALTQDLLARGNRYCCLYTDLANPTSNAIYARIGYRPVSDAAVYSVKRTTISS